MKLQKKEPLVESQLFIMELSRELNKICQVRLLCCFIYTASLNIQDLNVKNSFKIRFLFLLIESVHFNNWASLLCSWTTEVKHPLPHLDQWRRLAGQCVPRLHPGMGCWVTTQRPGNKFEITASYVCIFLLLRTFFTLWITITIPDFFGCFLSSWGLTSLTTSVRS